MIKLEEKVSHKKQAKDLVEPNQIEPIQPLPPPPCRSKRIFHLPESYLGTISKKVEEIFLVGNGVHGDDPKIYDKMILDIDSKKCRDHEVRD